MRDAFASAPLSSDAPSGAPKGRLFWYVYGVVVIVAFLAVVIGPCSLVIWLPDAIPPHRWIHVDGVALPNGQELHLLQKWSDDFYLTAIACTEKGRIVQVFLVDCDDKKQWRFNVQLDPNEKQATVTLGPKSVITYRWTNAQLFHDDCPWTPYTGEEFESEYGVFPTFDRVASSGK